MDVNTNSSDAQRRAMKLLDLLLLPFLRQQGVEDDDAILGCAALICGKLNLSRDLEVTQWVKSRINGLRDAFSNDKRALDTVSSPPKPGFVLLVAIGEGSSSAVGVVGSHVPIAKPAPAVLRVN